MKSLSLMLFKSIKRSPLLSKRELKVNVPIGLLCDPGEILPSLTNLSVMNFPEPETIPSFRIIEPAVISPLFVSSPFFTSI